MQQYKEKQSFGQKLEDARLLHASTLRELGRIHEDKLQSLEQELATVKSQLPSSSQSSSSSLASTGQKIQGFETLEREHQGHLETIQKSYAQEKKQLLKEHDEEIAKVQANFEKELTQAVAEHEVNWRVYSTRL